MSADGLYFFNATVIDYVGNRNFTATRNVTLDTTFPQVSIVVPTNKYIYVNESNGTAYLYYFNYSTTDTNINTCWYQNLSGDVNITVPCSGPSNFTIPYFGVDYTLRLWANDSANNLNYTSVNITAVNTTGEMVGPATALETASKNFTITLNRSSNVAVTPYFVYNGTVYSTGITNTTTNYTSTFSIPVLIGGTPQTQSYYWKFNMSYLGGPTQLENSSVKTISIFQVMFGACTSILNHTVLNITFKDEDTLLPMNATMDASIWDYTIGGVTKSFIFSNVSHNPQYLFCIYPDDADPIYSTSTLQYSSSDTGTYPQRSVTLVNNTYRNNTITNKTLYLLDANHGILSSYQVITGAGQVIKGVYINVQRELGGINITVAEGYTDDAGLITFFLSPNYYHTFTVSKTGYATQILSIKPTQGIYTIVLGTTSSYFYYNYTLEGISYVKHPASGISNCDRNRLHNFSFNVYSRNNNIQNCSFNIRTLNGTFLGSAFGCNSSITGSSGGIISTMMNVSNFSSFFGEYFITVNNTEYKLEGDARWRCVNVNDTAYWTSMRSALNDSLYLTEWGGQCGEGYHIGGGSNSSEEALWCYANDGSGDRYWNQTADFSRIVFFFLFFAVFLAILNFWTAYDTAYPGSLIYVLAFVVFLLSGFNGLAGPGFFYLPGATAGGFFCDFLSTSTNHVTSCSASRFMDNWIFAFFIAILTVVYFFTTNKRYQAG
jgi:hypothetical protein